MHSRLRKIPGFHGRFFAAMSVVALDSKYNPRARQVYVYTQNPMRQRTVLTQSVGEQSTILARN